MNHTPGSQLDNEKHEILLEEKVEHRQEIALPDILGMIVQKGRPSLHRWSPPSNLANVFLDSSFADVDVELQQFAADPFGAS